MAEVTYYWDAWSIDYWTNNRTYMVDGILTNYASTDSSGDLQRLDGTTCDGTDLGTITKVEVRAYGYGDGNDQIGVRIILAEPERWLTMPTTAGWSIYVDVTPDRAWSWDWVNTTRSYITYNKVGKGNTMYCAKVEIRVTYTPSGGAYYRGLTVQGVGELALCDVGSNPLRIRKGGVTYGIELVETDDPNASIVRIKIGAGIKAIRKYT